ncbi:MAG: glycoside hydrolase [Roseiflexus sp.]|jgi:spore germination protein|uniref:glycosyl hydrolase family 18 protein n=1 Tax=Roseiflexus sp. TaxID=2562120 RepID=UPI0025EB7FE7|nr:glycosyl hydrolase family 18 protein [Roseiflexus sp.]MCL6540927.1 glycoside hydrolase [Roseiflexus sp.]
MRHVFSSPLFVSIYAVSLIVWALLVADTVGLAVRATEPPVFPTPTLPPVTPVADTPTPALAIIPSVQAERTVSPVSALPEEGAWFHPKTGRYIAAWLPNSFGSENRESFEANADILDEISPFWYSPSPAGTLRFGREARDRTLIELARSKNVLVIPTVHNVVTGDDPAPGILRNPRLRSYHVQQIVDEVLTYDYDGIDIDYEFISSSLRDEYSAFIIELADALHAHGKLLTVAVHAKDCDYCGLGGFQDWAVIGQVVDRLRIMTYDYHWRGGGPGPVAPVYWVERVARYAVTVVDPAKVIIGVPFYGYNWPRDGGGNARGQTWAMINDIIQTYRLSVNLMESNQNGLVQENWITYSSREEGRREVWFATSSGLDAKLRLVQELDLAGIAIWRLGGEDPRNWEVIRSRLLQDPYESQRVLSRLLPEH